MLGGLLAATAFEAVALVDLALFPYRPSSLARLDLVEAGVFRALVPFSPALLVAVLYAWAFRLLISASIKRSKPFDHFIKTVFDPLRRSMGSIYRPETLERLRILRHPRLLLIIAIVSAALLGLVPYHPDLNPSGNPVGVDTPQYVDWINQMLQRPPGEALSYAFGQAGLGSRPLFLILLYFVASIGGVGADSVVKFQPAVLGPLLVLSSFILVRAGLRDERRAGVAAVIVGLSFNVTVGMWAGYYANWFALVEGNLLLASFLGFLEHRSNQGYTVTLGLTLTLLLTHPWTWIMILAIMLVFAVVRQEGKLDLSLVRSVVFLLVAGLLVDMLKGIASGGRLLGMDLATKTSVAGVPQLLMFWPSVVGATTITYEGLLGQPVLFVLALLSLPALRSKESFAGLLTCWIALASVPFAVFNSFHMSRIVYDLPIAIMASIGLLTLLSFIGKGEIRPTLVVVVVVLFCANYALRAAIQLGPP